MADRP